jgi:hypothetical protein
MQRVCRWWPQGLLGPQQLQEQGPQQLQAEHLIKQLMRLPLLHSVTSSVTVFRHALQCSHLSAPTPYKALHWLGKPHHKSLARPMKCEVIVTTTKKQTIFSQMFTNGTGMTIIKLCIRQAESVYVQTNERTPAIRCCSILRCTCYGQVLSSFSP